ncbi:MAG: four helix bundle protein [Candidatus Binatia bacterium]
MSSVTIMSIRDFRDLEVWRLGKQLVLLTYRLTESFPASEMYGLTSQMRRAAVSIPGNIAEGFGRYHYMDRVKFLLNARGSLNELKSHLLIARELQFVEDGPAHTVRERLDTLSVKLNNLIALIATTRKA